MLGFPADQARQFVMEARLISTQNTTQVLSAVLKPAQTEQQLQFHNQSATTSPLCPFILFSLWAFLQSSFARNVNVHQTAEAERNRAASCIGVQSAETRRAETLDFAESPASDALRCPESIKIKYHPSAGVRYRHSDSPCPFKGYRLRRRAFVLQTVLNEVIVSVLPSLSNSRVKSFQPLHCL